MTFFVAVSTLALLRAVRTREHRWWILYPLGRRGRVHALHLDLRAGRPGGVVDLAMPGSVAPAADRQRRRGAGVPAVAPAPAWQGAGGDRRLYPLTAGHVIKDSIRFLAGSAFASLSDIPGSWGLVVIGVCLALGVAAVLRSGARGVTRDTVGATGCAGSGHAGRATALQHCRDRPVAAAPPVRVDPAATLVIGALLAALRGPVRMAAVVALLATLAIGTIRSFGPDYVREPYRAMAALIDREARPQDRVLVLSIVGQPAIAAQLHKPVPAQTDATRLLRGPASSRRLPVPGRPDRPAPAASDPASGRSQAGRS